MSSFAFVSQKKIKQKPTIEEVYLKISFVFFSISTGNLTPLTAAIVPANRKSIKETKAKVLLRRHVASLHFCL